jgi:peroxiredoxin
MALSVKAGVSSGKAAPDFSLGSAAGEQVSLKDQLGHVVVLEWFNHDCPFVHKFYDDGYMQKWQADATARGVVWLTIDSTNPAHADYMNPAQARKVFEQMHMASTALLLDPDGTVGRLYGATNTPQVFVIGADGMLLYQGAVDDKRSSDAAEVNGAHNHLLDAVEAALKGEIPGPSGTRPYGCSVKYAD